MMPGCASVGSIALKTLLAGSIRVLPGLYQDGTLVAAPQHVTAVGKSEPLDILAAECIVGQRLGLGGDNHRLLR